MGKGGGVATTALVVLALCLLHVATAVVAQDDDSVEYTSTFPDVSSDLLYDGTWPRRTDDNSKAYFDVKVFRSTPDGEGGL